MNLYLLYGLRSFKFASFLFHLYSEIIIYKCFKIISNIIMMYYTNHRIEK